VGDSALSPEQRLDRLEARVDGAFALDARLRALEVQLAPKPPETRGRWQLVREWVGTLAGLATPILVAILGYGLKDSVDLALQREQLNL